LRQRITLNSAGRAHSRRPDKKSLKNKSLSITAYSFPKNQNKKMTNLLPSSRVLRPLRLSRLAVQQEISACLQPHIGDGRMFEFERASSLVGCDARTLRNYVNGTNLPPPHILLSLCGVFPFMLGRLLRFIGMGHARPLQPGMVDDFTLNSRIAALLAEVANDLEDKRIDAHERARLVPKVENLITVLSDWSARALAANEAAGHAGQQLRVLDSSIDGRKAA
jgi:hypothetical protein